MKSKKCTVKAFQYINEGSAFYMNEEANSNHIFQVAVFRNCPFSHNVGSRHYKNITSKSLCWNIESKPLINFSCVVSTSYNIEKESTGNFVASLSTRISKILQYEMTILVGYIIDIAIQIQNQFSFGCQSRGCKVGGLHSSSSELQSSSSISSNGRQ